MTWGGLLSCFSSKQDDEIENKVAAAPEVVPESTTVIVVKPPENNSGQAVKKGGKSQKAWLEDMAADQNAAKSSTVVNPFLDTEEDKENRGNPVKSDTQIDDKANSNFQGSAMDRLVNRSRADAETTFVRYDKDGDGYLSREDLFEGLKDWQLGLTPEMYRQYIDCNFMYADMDGDGLLNFEEYLIIHGMINEVKRKFQRFDKDQDGLINKSDFTKIVKELHLNLDPDMCRNYVDMNFRFVDRSFRGTITFGQFLACYANFLISHSLMHSKNGLDGRPETAGGTLVVEDLEDEDVISSGNNGPL